MRENCIYPCISMHTESTCCFSLEDWGILVQSDGKTEATVSLLKQKLVKTGGRMDKAKMTNVWAVAETEV